MGANTLKCKDCGGELDEFDFEICGRCKKKGRKTYDLKADDEELKKPVSPVYRVEIDPRLDMLYNRNVRCPYCRAKIHKYTTTCTRCGVTKKQISEASNKRAKEIQKEKKGGKLFKTKHRPTDVSFAKVALLCLLLGLFGAHSLYVGRKIRGFISLGCTLLSFILFIVFPIKTGNDGKMEMHPVHTLLGEGVPSLVALPVAVAFVLWAFDAFAVVLGFYKYPIRLGEAENKVKNEKVKVKSEG